MFELIAFVAGLCCAYFLGKHDASPDTVTLEVAHEQDAELHTKVDAMIGRMNDFLGAARLVKVKREDKRTDQANGPTA